MTKHTDVQQEAARILDAQRKREREVAQYTQGTAHEEVLDHYMLVHRNPSADGNVQFLTRTADTTEVVAQALVVDKHTAQEYSHKNPAAYPVKILDVMAAQREGSKADPGTYEVPAKLFDDYTKTRIAEAQTILQMMRETPSSDDMRHLATRMLVQTRKAQTLWDVEAMRDEMRMSLRADAQALDAQALGMLSERTPNPEPHVTEQRTEPGATPTEAAELHLYGDAAARARTVIDQAPELSHAIQLAINEAWHPGECEALERLQSQVDDLHVAMTGSRPPNIDHLGDDDEPEMRGPR